MDIRQLSYFVRVVELGSFSRASACLHIAQPALSRQIHNLEVELKDRLLVRTGRGVEPTEVGERLLAHARKVLSLVAQTYVDIDNARNGKSGKVSIGMPGTMSSALAAPLVRTLRAELADAQVSIVHGVSARLQEWLLAGQIDMAIMLDTPPSPMLDVTELAEEQLYLVGSPKLLRTGGPVTLQMLTSLPMIVGSRGNSVRALLDSQVGKTGQAMNIVFELDAFEPTFELAREGYGCTVAPMRTLLSKGGGRKGLVVRPFTVPGLALSVQLVLPARRPKSKLHDATFEILRDLGVHLLREEPVRATG